jgi:RNA polymerase primary sigma factor
MSNLSINTFSREDASLNRYFYEIGKEALLTRDKENELVREIRNGSRKALDILVKANLRFVVSIAKGYRNQGVPLCDLINEGNLGLIKAAKRFDETKGYKFLSFAVWWIRDAILSGLAEDSRFVRIPRNKVCFLRKISKTRSRLEQELGRDPSTNEIADELEICPYDVMDTLRISSRHQSLDAPFNDDEDDNLLDVLNDLYQPSPDEEVMGNSLKLEIEKVLSQLTDREADVIRLFFGINRDNPLTLEDIGKIFKISRERVRQIKDTALRRLRHRSRSENLRKYDIERASA